MCRPCNRRSVRSDAVLVKRGFAVVCILQLIGNMDAGGTVTCLCHCVFLCFCVFELVVFFTHSLPHSSHLISSPVLPSSLVQVREEFNLS